MITHNTNDLIKRDVIYLLKYMCIKHGWDSVEEYTCIITNIFNKTKWYYYDHILYYKNGHNRTILGSITSLLC